MIPAFTHQHAPLTTPTILPGRTRVVDAVRIAHDAGAGLWLTDKGQVVVAPRGLPGWHRLPLRLRRTLPCAA